MAKTVSDYLVERLGGVNPSLTIRAIACRSTGRIKTLASRGEP